MSINNKINNKINILIVEKNGNIKETQIKINETDNKKKDFEYDKLYKKCGFKTPDNFIKQTEWDITINNLKLNINIYAKKTGRSNLENKYEFPPPIDNVLFFGNVCILAKEYINNERHFVSIKTSNSNLELINKIIPSVDDVLFFGKECLSELNLEFKNETIPYNLTIKDWNVIYDKLYGGFEDLKNDEERSMEEDDIDDERSMEEDDIDDERSMEDAGKNDDYKKNEKKMTKSGYVKNKFIVDDDFIEYDEDYEERHFVRMEDNKYIIDKNFIKKDNDDYDYNIDVIGTELSEEEYINEV
jgi:hypothetical protein